MQTKTKKLTVLAMLCAVAYLVMLLGQMLPPVVLFLQYDPKDIIITAGGFLLGPLSAVAISVLVSLLEMFTVSSTGPVGAVMNIVSTCAFTCPAAVIYQRRRSVGGAAAGLFAGWLSMTAVMLLWNYCLTPIYMEMPRSAVAAMLLPVFLPFNLLKGGLNASITMLLYKPLVGALRTANLMPPAGTTKTTVKPVLIVASLFVVLGCVLLLVIL